MFGGVEVERKSCCRLSGLVSRYEVLVLYTLRVFVERDKAGCGVGVSVMSRLCLKSKLERVGSWPSGADNPGRASVTPHAAHEA